VTVKDRVGRTRYVAFRVDPPTSRAACEKLLPPTARLTRFDGTFGIARTTHRAVAALLDHLRAQSVTIQTLTTSGTMRAAAARLPASSEASKRGAKGTRFK